MENMYSHDRLWPRTDDLTAVSLGLIRLQQTYHLDFKELATGTLNDTTHDPLTVDEFYDIAVVGIEKTLSKSALLWLNATLKRIESGEAVQTPTLTATHVRLKMIEILEKVRKMYVGLYISD
jgi:hypothetical protein